MTHVVLRLTLEQAETLRIATEALARLGMNQTIPLQEHYEIPSDSRLELVREIERKMQSLGCRRFCNLAERHLVYQRSWDLYEVIRHALAWRRNPQGGITVDFDKPWGQSDQPLATLAFEEDTEKENDQCLATPVPS